MSFICENCSTSVPLGARAADIELSRACEDCVEHTRDPQNKHRIALLSKSSALAKISAQNLKTLNCKLVRNPHYSSSAPMSLYLEIEVDLVKREEEREDREVEKRATNARDERVSDLPFALNDIPLNVRAEVLGDFADVVQNKYFKPKTSKRKVIQAMKKVPLAQEVYDLINQDEMIGPMCTNASAILLRYCVVSGTATAYEIAQKFIQTQYYMRQAFECEVMTLVSFLKPLERAEAERALPGFRQAVKLRTMRRKEALLACVLRLGGSAKLLTAKPTKKRVARYMRYLRYDADTVAVSLCDFEKTAGNNELREKRLKTALDKRDLSRRYDSSFCNDYVYGRVDVDPEEVAGIMYIVASLWEAGGSRAFVEYSDEAENNFEKAVFHDGMSWDEGVRVSLKILSRVRRRNFHY